MPGNAAPPIKCKKNKMNEKTLCVEYGDFNVLFPSAAF